MKNTMLKVSRRTPSGVGALMAGTIVVSAMAALMAACTPTINVKVEPITIYAKLDADVRVRLDEDLKRLIAQNPNLF